MVRDRRGTATVEMAVLVPFLMFLLLGIWEVGRALNVTAILQNAAAVGARQASTGLASNTQVKQSVLAYLSSAGMPTTNATVTVADLTKPGADVGSADQLDQLQVTVSVPFSDVRWAVSGFIVKNTTAITGTATYYSARVDPYPTNITSPAGF